MSFTNKNVLITGASRGIGKAIAIKLAAEGANVAIASKTVEEHPKLEGTIYSAAEEIDKAGAGKVIALQADIRNEEQINDAVRKTAEAFGGIDILINNASAINLTSTEQIEAKRYDSDARHQCARNIFHEPGLHPISQKIFFGAYS